MPHVKDRLDYFSRGDSRRPGTFSNELEEHPAVGILLTQPPESPPSTIKENLVKCPPAYAMYKSSVVVACNGIVYPFASFWFCVATYLVIGIPAMFMALFMSTLYSRKTKPKLVIEQRFTAPVIPDTFAAAKRTYTASVVSVKTKDANKKEPPPSSSSSSCSTDYGDCLLDDDNFDIYIRVKKPHRNEDKPEAVDPNVKSTAKRETEVNANDEVIISYDDGSKPVAKINVKGDRKEIIKDNKAHTDRPSSVEKQAGLDEDKRPDKTKVQDKKATLTTKERRGSLAGDAQEKKESKAARNLGGSSRQNSTTEVRALLYEPPQSPFGRTVRAMPQRRLSDGLGSSVLDSITSSSVHLARSLFSRYRTVRGDSEDEGSSLQPSSP
ncbi:hypothetical protein HPB52_000281 [Rhipicephalus sanguineus]|uniref:Uncharacterized protein n=1 Tax=Rhipicephalus sanguineus TaxID=34632 RepID=A0A9D4PTB7_RHISA|nr:hypothetical protein HPB52_000281 [Rhipicephalus sanguineus]